MVEEQKRSRNAEAISLIGWAEVPLRIFRGGMEGELFSLFPSMAFRKDQVVLWPLVGFKFEINDDHACFFENKIFFFFTASYFFQADLLPVARGERRQSISACILLHFSLRSTTGDRVLLGVWSLGTSY